MNILDLRNQIEQNLPEVNNVLKECLNDIDVFTIIFPHGENLLHFASGSGNLEMCDYLIKVKGIHPNIYNCRGSTPLIYASLKNHLDVVKFLLENGADPRIRSGFSGLFPYQSTSSEEIKKILLKSDIIVPIDYENNLCVKIGYNLSQSYKYRLHKYWLSFVSNQIFLIAEKPQIDRLPETEEIKKEISQGFENLLAKYKELYDDYLQSLKSTYFQDKCLNCLKTRNQCSLFKCSRCKNILVCGKSCQKIVNILHKYDCKTH